MQDSDILRHFAMIGLDTADSQPEDGWSGIDVDDTAEPLPQRQPTDSSIEKTLELSDTQVAGLEQKQPFLDVDGLMQQCIHAAGAILKDPEDMTDRKTERVQLLLQLLKPQQSEDRGELI